MNLLITGISSLNNSMIIELWLKTFKKIFNVKYNLFIDINDIKSDWYSEQININKIKILNTIENFDGKIFSFTIPRLDAKSKNKTIYYVNDEILTLNKNKYENLDLFSEFHLEELAEHFDNNEINDLQNRFLTFYVPTERYIENLEIPDTRKGVCVLSDTKKGGTGNDMDSVYKILTERSKLKLIYLSELHKIEDLLTEVSKFNHVCVKKIDFSILIHVLYFCNKLGIKFSYHSDIKFESAKRFIITGCFNYFTKFLETSHFSLRKHILDLLNNQPNKTHNHASDMIGNPCVILYNKNSHNSHISLGDVDCIYNHELIDHPSIANNEHRDLINLYLRIFHASAEYDQIQSLKVVPPVFSKTNLSSGGLLYLLNQINSKLNNCKHINRYYKNIAYLLSENNNLEIAKVIYDSNIKIKYFYYYFVSRNLYKDFYYYDIFFSSLDSTQIQQIKHYLSLLEDELSDNRSDSFKVSDQNMSSFLIILLKIAYSELEDLVEQLKKNKTFTWNHYSTFSFILYTYGQKDLSLQVFELIDINSLSINEVACSYHVMMLFTCDIIHKKNYFNSSIENISFDQYLNDSYQESYKHIPLNSFCYTVIFSYFSKNQDFLDDYIKSNPTLSPMYDRINEYLSFNSSKANS